VEVINNSVRIWGMTRWLSIAALLCTLAGGGCANLSFLPAEAAATLAHPTHVEAYRTGKLDDHPGYGGKMDGFAVINTGDASPELAHNLGSLFSDPATYLDDVRPNDFVPSVGYRFYRRLNDSGGAQVCIDVLIAFDCDEVLLVARDSKLKETFRRMMESDPAREKLLEASRQAFEFDQLIQSLSEVRPAASMPSP